MTSAAPDTSPPGPSPSLLPSFGCYLITLYLMLSYPKLRSGFKVGLNTAIVFLFSTTNHSQLFGGGNAGSGNIYTFKEVLS